MSNSLRSGRVWKWFLFAHSVFFLFSLASLHAGGARWGEFGGSLEYLRSCYTAPRLPGESNFYIDMLDRSFPRFARVHGLTNNHALFIVSHGQGYDSGFGPRYAFYPEKSTRNVPQFSVGDLARLLGPANARQIQILVIAGCNQENLLSTKELRRHFPNATTIIHATPSTDANLASFWEMLTYRSQDLAALHSPADLVARHFGPVGRAKGGSYIADIFQPGDRKPFRQQIAGRELLDPSLAAPPAFAQSRR